MAEEGADALIELRRNDVLEFAGLCVRFGFIDGERVFEEALGEAMPTNDIASALRPGGRQMNIAIGQVDETKVAHTREDAPDRLFRQKPQVTGGTFHAQCACLRRLPFFTANPYLLEQMIKSNLIFRRGRRVRAAAIGSVHERASQRMTGAVLRGIEVQMPVRKLDAPV